MSTPSEGPDPAARLREALTAKGYTQEQADVMMDMAGRLREMQQRMATLEARRSGLRRWGPTVGVAAAAAGAASAQGQEAIGNVGKWIGDQAAAGADYAGRKWDEAVQTASQNWQDFTREAGQAWDGVTRQAGQAWDTATREAGQAWDSAVQGAQSAWNGVSGWGVETWHSASDTVTQAAHSIGAWATQYADAVAQNPSHAAATAAVTAGAIVAATPQLRQAVGRAANAASRWARNGFDAVRHPGETMRQISNAIRSNETVQRAINAVGLDRQRTNEGLNEVTGAVSRLPKPEQMVVSTLANDPAMKPAGTKVAPGQAAEAGTDQGEATNRTTSNPERGGGLNK